MNGFVSHYYYTQEEDEVCTENTRSFNERSQVYFDYHGSLDRDADEADCYVKCKAVSLA